MENTTKSRIDQLQLRDYSRLVVLAVCKSEDLSEKDVAFTCPFVLIVNVSYHCIILLLSYSVREERILKNL